MNIQIKLENGIWVPAYEYQKHAFIEFENNDGDNEEIKFTISRKNNNAFSGIYLERANGTKSPIADWNNVKVFLLDKKKVNWYDARKYQTWAYFDYVYSNDPSRGYKSHGTVGHNDYIELPIEELEPDIIFTMSRNDNGSIYYEKNDSITKVRISDHELYRKGYLGFYHRMTEPIF